MKALSRALPLVATLLLATHAQRSGNSFSPRSESPFPENVKRLRVPNGFNVGVWARDLGNIRMLAVADDGTVYATRYGEGDVLALKDQNGKVSTRTVARLGRVHGIAIKNSTMWLTTVENLYTAQIAKNGSLSAPKRLSVTFSGGGHDRRTVAFGPDGSLYASVGSTCNICKDPPDENAVIWRVKPDGSSREVFAKGLRNTIGFDWHPETKELWGMDHGVDWLGDDYPREELNRLESGKDYGWPYCTNEQKPDTRMQAPQPNYCQRTVAPALTYTAHAAPIWMLFYTGSMFPAEYRNDAFVAMHGSWNRRPASGYEVVRIKFEHGKPVKFEPFLTGFLLPDGKSQFGRPAGLAVMKDGSLLVSDDDSGVIYRVTYKK
jgi:glucose/arabinose dehydrogenase